MIAIYNRRIVPSKLTEFLTRRRYIDLREDHNLFGLLQRYNRFVKQARYSIETKI